MTDISEWYQQNPDEDKIEINTINPTNKNNLEYTTNQNNLEYITNQNNLEYTTNEEQIATELENLLDSSFTCLEQNTAEPREHPPHTTFPSQTGDRNRVAYIAQQLCSMDASTDDWLKEIDRFSDELLKQKNIDLSDESLIQKNMDQNNNIETTTIENKSKELEIMNLKNDESEKVIEVSNKIMIMENQTQQDKEHGLLNLKLTDEFLQNCDTKSKDLITGILKQKYELEQSNQNNNKNEINNNNVDNNNNQKNTNTTNSDVSVHANQLNHEENGRKYSITNSKDGLHFVKSAFVLDPEGEDEPIGNIKKLFSTLIYQNHELRRNQNEAVQRESRLKSELTMHQQAVENKLDNIHDQLATLCDLRKKTKINRSPKASLNNTNNNQYKKSPNLSRKRIRTRKVKKSPQSSMLSSRGVRNYQKVTKSSVKNSLLHKKSIPTVNETIDIQPEQQDYHRVKTKKKKRTHGRVGRTRRSSSNRRSPSIKNKTHYLTATQSSKNKKRYPKHSFRFKEQNWLETNNLSLTMNLNDLSVTNELTL